MVFLLRYILLNAFLIIHVRGALTVEPLTTNHPFNLKLYEEVLNPEKCREQLIYLRNSSNSNIAGLFVDASFRFPRNIHKANFKDFGSYFECLEIRHDRTQEDAIEGKYCLVNFPLSQSIELPTLPSPNITLPGTPWPEFPWPNFDIDTLLTEENKKHLSEYEKARIAVQTLTGDFRDTTPLRSSRLMSNINAQLAVCIPKVCTTREVFNFFTFNLTGNLQFEEQYCRLPNDKNWVTVDYIAVILLAIIGLLSILSTAYDVRHTIILKNDPKKANKLYQSFSVYTNTKALFTFHTHPNMLACLDGIRAFAMLWVIVGHTFVTQLQFVPENPLDIREFMIAFSSLWITSATITVDTFFVISGLLIVYTTAAKVSRISLLKNLHLFYLNRLLRMFPVLAFGILMTASFLYRLTDGPYFVSVAKWVTDCRSNWWSTLLYVQNFLHPTNMCLSHTWYLAIDMQLYIFSPIVLFFVLGQRKRIAWSSILLALLGFIIAATVYNFINNFQSAVVSLSRPDENSAYLRHYYIHTLPRAAPFFVGMLFGYALHVTRGQKIKIPTGLVLLLWALSLGGIFAVCSTAYMNIQVDWDNQLVDNLLNSYMRPFWGTCIGWIIFSCSKGYGGPINWVLSLTVFKILGRLSYAMYILHFPIIYLLNATTLKPIYFSVNYSIQKFMVDLNYTIILALLVTVFVDYPFTNLIKMAIGGGNKRRPPPPPKEKPSLSNSDPEDLKAETDLEGDLRKAKM